MRNVQRSFSIRCTADRLRRSSSVLSGQSIRCVFCPPLSCLISKISCTVTCTVTGETHVSVWQAPLQSQAGYRASDCVSDGTNGCWGPCLMGAHTHSQTYKLTSQRLILQLLHSRRQLLHLGHGSTSLTTLLRRPHAKHCRFKCQVLGKLTNHNITHHEREQLNQTPMFTNHRTSAN